MDDLGAGTRSQIGTCYGTVLKGPRYLELTEGYVTSLALDQNSEIIGYEFVNLSRMMECIRRGTEANEALRLATGKYGRFDEGILFMDPRRE
jgi:hypothetical protein